MPELIRQQSNEPVLRDVEYAKCLDNVSRDSVSSCLFACHVAGEKLSESVAGDVRQLCNTLLNCYLTQVMP